MKVYPLIIFSRWSEAYPLLLAVDTVLQRRQVCDLGGGGVPLNVQRAITEVE